MNRALLFLGCFLLFVMSPRAQDVLSSPPTTSPSAPAVQDFNANEPGTIPVPDASIGTPALATPFQWGPIQARPHLLYRFLYGNGIPAHPGEDTTTAIHQVSPGVLLQIGSHWSIDYTPTFYDYSSSKFTDHLDQALHLNFGSAYRDWVINFNQNYIASSTPIVETAQQTDQQNHNTSLDAYYSISSQWSLQLGLVQNLRFTPDFNDLHEWSTTDWLVYQWAPRLQLSGGISAIYDNVESGADMTSQQYLGRINWTPGAKTTFEVHGGLEDRQILHSSAGDLLNPVFGANFTYLPFTYTEVKLSADRTITPTFFNNQVTDRVDLKGSIRQRFFEHFWFTVTGEYANTDYIETVAGTPTVRRDNYYSVNFRLTTAVMKRGSISVFYTLSDNTSDNEAFAFNSNQGGVELGVAY